jgi:hypothetical protein
MEVIKKIYICAQNILMVDMENKLWIVGENDYRKTGFGTKNKSLYSPVYTGIILDSDETVSKFYTYERLLSIYTSKGKLFISRNLSKNTSDTKNGDEYVPSQTTEPTNNATSEIINVNNESNHINVQNRLFNAENATNEHGSLNGASQEGMTLNFPDGAIYLTPDMYMEEENLSDNNIDSDGDNGDGDNGDGDNGDGDNGDDEDKSNCDVNDNDSNSNDDNDSNSYMGESQAMEQLGIFDNNNYDIVFDNLEFFSDLVYTGRPKIQNTEGIDLLDENIENVVYSADTIFFQKDGKLYVYKKNIDPVGLMIQKNFGCSIIKVRKGKYQYFQIILPFDYEKIVFHDNYVYLNSGTHHHIFSAFVINIGVPGNILTWIYFKTDFRANENNIYFVPTEGTVYVKNGNSIYKYCHAIQDIKQFVDDNAKTFILPSNDGISRILYCIRDDGLYFDHGNLQKEVECSDFLPYVIDMNSYFHSKFVIIDIDDQMKYIIKGKTLFFNIHGYTHYKLLDTGFIYYDNNSKSLYYCTTEVLLENKYGTTEINRINMSGVKYYIYTFNNLPTTINEIQFTNNLIIIQSDGKYYYHTISTKNFCVDKFTELAIHNNPNDMQLVSKHYIVRNKKEFEQNVALTVNISANKFDKLFNIIEMLDNSSNFSINFMKGTTSVSYGDGPKREFMETAVMDFSEKYLTKHNLCCEFNIDKIQQFSDDDLICIGSMLHTVICHSNNHLPIRLPLPLVTTILRKEPSVAELEYFAKLEDPDAFNILYECKSDPEKIKDYGYDTYEQCLAFLCKYYHSDAKTNSKIMHICSEISKGFKNYNEIKNLSIMNSPTLDYFLSGDYHLDRDLLIKNLKTEIQLDNKYTDFKETIIKVIRSLPEEKLAILLKNWSGTAIVKKSISYRIVIEPKEVVDNLSEHSDISFATCNVELTISENLISNLETKNLLIELLTTPINTMRDN